MRMLVTVLMAVAGMGLALPGPLEPTLRFHSRRQTAEPRLGDLIQEFALDLSSVSLNPDTNVVFSPYSISSLLSMLLLGTSGTTYYELRRALLLPANANDAAVHNAYRTLMNNLIQNTPGMTINVANRLFVQNGVVVLSNFSEDAQRYYGIKTRGLDFAQNPGTARDTINAWVSQETRGKIPRLLDFISPETSAVAVNTVYLKGLWQTPFERSSTKQDTFTTSTRNISVPMMHAMTTVPYVYIRESDADMIALPYEGGKFAMFFIVPRGPIAHDGLEELEFSLDANILNHYISRMNNTFMNINVPRMSIKYKANLVQNLQELGVNNLFGFNADLSRMTTSNVRMNQLIHMAVMEITEEGTVAAAASASSFNRIGTSRFVKVNRPSIVFIRDLENGVPLFWGRLHEPEPLNSR